MKTVGIIAEYNPFHLGHEYHIKEAQKKSQADCVLAVMSGDYVQRGEPAFCDKYIRTQASLLSGIDLVIELPVEFATASAERFAFGGVSLLNALQVDSMAFGMEADSMNSLLSIAQLLAEEPAAYSVLLNQYLSTGLSMPAARMKAVSDYTGKDYHKALSSPNNILAIEYLKALRRTNSSITPLGIQRVGNGYHESDPDCLPSATMLRKLYDEDGLCALSKHLPSAVYDYLCTQRGLGIKAEDLSDYMNYAIKTSEDLTLYEDVNESISNKIQKAYRKKSYYTFSELTREILSKELTITRVQRALLHILLRLQKSEPSIQYIRVLGMTKKGQAFLNQHKKDLSLPLITTLSSADASIDLSKELLASDIYHMLLRNKYGIESKNEYQRQLIRL